MIYTTYFAMLKRLPQDITPISIALFSPDWYDGLQFQKLAPTPDILYSYKSDHNRIKYTLQFKKQILDNLIFDDVYSNLQSMVLTKDIALVCYEKSSEFCHRHLVSAWFRKNLVPCHELNFYDPSVSKDELNVIFTLQNYIEKG